VTVDDGFVEIQARLKRFAKVAGEMVSLEVVERIAAQARPEAVHAAVSYRDPARGENIVLFTDDPTVVREDLRDAARRMGAPEIAIPRRIERLDEIPVLGNGKKDYTTMARMAETPAETPA
jgi:acyl-[acyl-carrier-protein]-phospholipid O-acyltransferase/long-chain-fatty-acid--[acyl-carrier-protein] ligase